MTKPMDAKVKAQVAKIEAAIKKTELAMQKARKSIKSTLQLDEALEKESEG